jgi:hypothetical protein
MSLWDSDMGRISMLLLLLFGAMGLVYYATIASTAWVAVGWLSAAF